MKTLYVRMVRRLIVPLAAVVALVIALTSGGTVPTVSPAALSQAAALTGHVAGADLAGTVRVSTAGRSMNMSMSGFESLAKRAGVLTMRVNNLPGLSGGSAAFEMRFLYPLFYMRSPLFGALLPAGKQWVRFNLARVAREHGINPALLSSAQSDPAQYLEYLKALSGRVQNLGTEQVRGVLTTHYHAVTDLSRSASAFPAAKRAAVEQGFAKIEQLTGLSRIPVDVWVDSRHLIRQMRINLSIRSSAQIPNGLSETVTVDLFNFGPKPAVAPPPADQTDDLSSLPGAGG